MLVNQEHLFDTAAVNGTGEKYNSMALFGKTIIIPLRRVRRMRILRTRTVRALFHQPLVDPDDSFNVHSFVEQSFFTFLCWGVVTLFLMTFPSSAQESQTPGSQRSEASKQPMQWLEARRKEQIAGAVTAGIFNTFQFTDRVDAIGIR